MNIAYLTGINTKTVKGGGAVHASQIAQGLIKKGHKLYTNMVDESSDFINIIPKSFKEQAKELQVYYIRIDGAPEKDKWTLYRRFNPDAVCIWEVNAPVEELRANNISEAKINIFNSQRKVLARLVDAAICVSEEMEEYARTYLGIKRTYVLPNGSDYKQFSPGKKDLELFPSEKFKIIWTGSSEFHWQGINMVRNIADRLKNMDENILLIVTADGPSTENILFINRIPYTEIPRYIASADAGLCIYDKIRYYPKFYFSPLKLFDYMACALPVIGSNVGQIKSIVDENRNGLLVNTSIDDIVEKIKYFKNNRGVAKDMGGKGRDAIVSKYNWDTIVSNTEKIIVDVSNQIKHEQFSRKMKFIWARRWWTINRLLL